VLVTRLDHATFDWRTGSGGAADVRLVADAAAARDGREPLNEAARLTLANHGLDGGVVLSAGAAGFAYLHGLSGDGRPELDLVVHPLHRGLGVGTALASAMAGLAPDLPVTAWSHGDHPAAARLAARHGFAPARELWLMRAPLPGRTAPPPPPGVVVRGFRRGADEEALLAVNAAAFASHPEQGSLRRSGLEERMAEPWFDPDGLLLAVSADDGRLLGFHWTKVHPAGAQGPPFGEVYVIGVAPDEQGRHLGRALLEAGLAHLAGRGLDQVVLYVEHDNHHAVRLYQAMGFTHADRDTDVMYTRH
jgi:mycothiol synthase